MFTARYFNPRYWASRFWAKVGGVAASEDCEVAFQGEIRPTIGFEGLINATIGFQGLIDDSALVLVGHISGERLFEGFIDPDASGFEGKITDSIGFNSDVC